MTTTVVKFWPVRTEIAWPAMASAEVVVGWVGQVEPEGDVDPVPGAAAAGDDQAAGGGEAEQVRDDGEHGGRGVDADGLVAGGVRA